jgi:molybdenum cofactor biosynthesis protein A
LYIRTEMQIIDQHNRPINYLRLAVTDRCNLRCSYCMPEQGIQYLSKAAVMSYEEMLRMVRIMANMGISKVRITGGEPFVRQNLMEFLYQLADIEGINEIALTTNGVLTAPHIQDLKALGIKSINLSLDTLDKDRFHKITRRNEYDAVMKSLYLFLEHGFDLKINAVIMDGINDIDILPLSEFTKNNKIGVRFIEEMPFNGKGNNYTTLKWDFLKIIETIKSVYPDLQKLKDPLNSTSYNYQIPNHLGSVGVIAAYSRTFCGTCNRIRVTAQGELKTCLYDNGGLSIRDLLREHKSDEEIADILRYAISKRAKDGLEAESLRPEVKESMSTIGG